MKNKDGSPNTSHTTNPVPVILVDKNKRNIRNGILADIAPTGRKVTFWYGGRSKRELFYIDHFRELEKRFSKF